MHFDGNHFSFSAIWTCFLKNKNGRARKSYKKSVSLTSNKCSCLNLRKNQRKQTKKKNVLILEFEPGTLRLQYWTGQLSDHHDCGSWLVPYFESLGIYYQECRILKQGNKLSRVCNLFQIHGLQPVSHKHWPVRVSSAFLNLNFGNAMKLHFRVWDIWCKYTLERLPCW